MPIFIAQPEAVLHGKQADVWFSPADLCNAILAASAMSIVTIESRQVHHSEQPQLTEHAARELNRSLCDPDKEHFFCAYVGNVVMKKPSQASDLMSPVRVFTGFADGFGLSANVYVCRCTLPNHTHYGIISVRLLGAKIFGRARPGGDHLFRFLD